LIQLSQDKSEEELDEEFNEGNIWNRVNRVPKGAPVQKKTCLKAVLMLLDFAIIATIIGAIVGAWVNRFQVTESGEWVHGDVDRSLTAAVPVIYQFFALILALV
jgi:hypothetical protein